MYRINFIILPVKVCARLTESRVASFRSPEFESSARFAKAQAELSCLQVLVEQNKMKTREKEQANSVRLKSVGSLIAEALGMTTLFNQPRVRIVGTTSNCAPSSKPTNSIRHFRKTACSDGESIVLSSIYLWSLSRDQLAPREGGPESQAWMSLMPSQGCSAITSVLTTIEIARPNDEIFRQQPGISHVEGQTMILLPPPHLS